MGNLGPDYTNRLNAEARIGKGRGVLAARRTLTKSSLMTWHSRSSSQPSWRPFSRTRSPMLTWRRPAASERREQVVVFPVPGVPVTSTFGRGRRAAPPFAAAIGRAGFLGFSLSMRNCESFIRAPLLIRSTTRLWAFGSRMLCGPVSFACWGAFLSFLTTYELSNLHNKMKTAFSSKKMKTAFF